MKSIKFNKTLCKALILVLVFISIVVVSIFVLDYLEQGDNKNQENLNESENIQTDDTNTDRGDGTYYNGNWYKENENISTWLFYGMDKYKAEIENYQDSYTQADFLILFVVDDKNKTFKTIQINRDSMLNIDVLSLDGSEVIGSTFAQLTLAHTYGTNVQQSAKNVVRSCSTLLFDAHIDNYIGCTLDFIPAVTDMLGGIEVEMLEDFSNEYPNMVKGETVKLNGEQALAYVQHRVNIGDQTNLERMKRQSQFIDALEDKVSNQKSDNSNFTFDLITTISDYIYSDASIQTLSSIFDKQSSYENLGNYTLEGEAVVGEEFMEFYPDDVMLKELVIDLFYTLDE